MAKNSWSLPHLTDKAGKTLFYVDRNSSGSFAAFLNDKLGQQPGKTKAPNVFVTFEVQQETPVGKNYRIVLTDEQVKAWSAKRVKAK